MFVRQIALIVSAYLTHTGIACAQQTPQPAPASQPPACQAASYRAFDFWLGEWRAYVTGTDRLAGLSTIKAEDAGCVITEHWRSQQSLGFTGRSLNTYSAEAKHWEQFWVDSSGDITHFIGGPTADGMVLTAEDDIGPGALDPIFNRMTFTRNADGSVRQRGQASTDRGKTWSDRYDFTYRRAAQ